MTDFYIAACDNEGGIFHYRLQGEQIVQKQFSPIDRPMYMEIKNEKLYAVLRDPENNGNSGIVNFKIDNNGNLTEMSDVTATLGVVGCHLTATDKGVFVANYVSGSVFRTPDLLVTHEGVGPNPKRQEGPHIHCTVLTPDEKYVCVADLGLDKVFIYDLDLKLVNTVELPWGVGPRHIVFSENGKFMYCITELSNEVYAFSYDNGKFKLLNSVSTLPEDFRDVNTAAAIRISNGYLYASNRGHNSIAVYKIDGGKMERLAIVDCGGIGPRDFNIFEDLLICTNENSNDVTFFKLQNGIPEIIDFKLEMPNPLNIIFK